MRKLVLFAPVLVFLASLSNLEASIYLPNPRVFRGHAQFERLVQEAQRQNWRSLPLGDRTIAVGQALLGTPYVNYTLEIDDHTESPSVNLNGVDCWTFFEIALG